MRKFVITIEETVSKDFEILAENAGKAMKIAEDKYQNGELVLDPGNIMFKQMVITEPTSEATEWIEF